jgi:cell division topological specificity factor
MSLFSFFKTRGTAPVARERLQILLAHERITLGPRNLIAILRDEILATIAKHIEIAPEALKIKMGQDGAVSTLEIDVELPTEKIGAHPARHAAPLPQAMTASR